MFHFSFVLEKEMKIICKYFLFIFVFKDTYKEKVMYKNKGAFSYLL